MNSHTELTVWQKSVDFVVCLYSLTKKFPSSEQFNLVSQMQRSAVSIPSNIAEGYARKTRKEFIYFLRIAYGSSAELETQIEITYRLDLLADLEYTSLREKLTEIRKMLNKLISTLSTKH